MTPVQELDQLMEDLRDLLDVVPPQHRIHQETLLLLEQVDTLKGLELLRELREAVEAKHRANG